MLNKNNSYFDSSIINMLNLQVTKIKTFNINVGTVWRIINQLK